MLNIIDKRENDKLTIKIEGTLDTLTAPEFKAKLKVALSGITSLVIDMEKLEYISSDGLRVLVFAQKAMSKQGSMIVKNVSEDIMEIFEITNFSDFLTIE